MPHLQFIAFNSLNYIFFLALWIALFYVYPVKSRWIILLLASVTFYIFAGVEKFPFILGTSLIVWFCAGRISRAYEAAEVEVRERRLTGKERAQFMAACKRKNRNRWLLPAIAILLGVLCYCKFFERLTAGISALLGTGTINWNVIVPLGISYYTFSSLGYLLDVYWRKAPYEKNYFKFALCVFYFPQIVQGPIARYQRLMPQFFRENRFDFRRVCFGIQLMLYGYFKKMVIADRLAIFTGYVWNHITAYEGLVFPITLVFSTFQLYADFSGCMDIVRGTSQIFGIELDQNFDHPFFSKSTAEFWRRWHITLGTWFKDYVFLPVASSMWLIRLTSKIKKKFGRTIARYAATAIPLMSVWILTGLWHGIAWNYLAWGMYFGGIIICSTIFGPLYQRLNKKLAIDTASKGWVHFQMLRTFLVFMFGRLIVVPGNLHLSWAVVKRTFRCFNPWILWDGTLYGMGLNYKNLCVAFLSLLLVRKISMMQEQGSVREYIAGKNIVLRWAIYYAAIFAILIFGIYGPGYDAKDFIYMQF